MTETTISSKTRTKVIGEEFSINCFADKNADGSVTPEIFKSEVLDSKSVVDNQSGIEGELILSSDEENCGALNTDGELNINVENDDAERYSKNDNGELIYTT